MVKTISGHSASQTDHSGHTYALPLHETAIICKQNFIAITHAFTCTF